MPLSSPRAEVATMLLDLRQKLFSWLPLPTAYLVLYIYLLTSYLDGIQPAPVTLSMLTVVVTGLLAQRLREDHWHWAAGLYLTGLVAAACGLILHNFVTVNTLALLLIVVLLAVNLAGRRATLLLVTAMTASISFYAWWHSLPILTVLGPLSALWITVLLAWLANRNLITALEWAWNSYNQSQVATEEARRHRADLAQTLKTLDSAYYRLERFSMQLAHARNSAEEARRAKQQFVANVSHELRTPLNIIIGFSESMVLSPESYGVTAIPRPFMGDVNRIYRSAQHLKKLIDDVLDLSQIDAQRLPLFLDRLPIGHVIAEAVDMIEPLALQKGLTLTVDVANGLPPVLMDQLRVRQVLLNLLSNAVRFTERGGIHVCAESGDDAITIVVEDSGPGIAPENLERVFEMFQQLDDPLSKRYDGTGLGLALSRRFVELHGGRMGVESRVGQGSRFFFTLPVSAAPGQVTSNGQTLTPILMAKEIARYGPTILVAADEPMSADLLKRHLRDYQVKRVPVDELPGAVDTYLPHAVIYNNIHAESSPPAHPLNTQATVINCPLPDAGHLARSLGIDHFLVKPIVRERLLDLLDAYGDDVHHLLIIDDDPQLGELISRIAHSAPRRYTVDIACGGVEGLERMAEQRPDVILLDYMMPNLTGLDVLAAMRADPTLHDVPVVMITARDLPGEELQMPRHSRISLDTVEGLSLSEVLRTVQAILDALPQPTPTTAPAAMQPAVPMRQSVS